MHAQTHAQTHTPTLDNLLSFENFVSESSRQSHLVSVRNDDACKCFHLPDSAGHTRRAALVTKVKLFCFCWERSVSHLSLEHQRDEETAAGNFRLQNVRTGEK